MADQASVQQMIEKIEKLQNNISMKCDNTKEML